MKRFQFKLQRLLEYREHLEKQEQDKFSKVLGQYVGTEQIIETAHQNKNRVLKESQSFIDKGDLHLFYYREKARKGLQTKMNDFTKILQEQAIPLENARKNLLEAMKNKKAIDILKQKAKTKHQEEMQKEEQMDLDEFGATAYLRDQKLTLQTIKEKF